MLGMRILTYHSVGDYSAPDAARTVVSAGQFEKQCRLLALLGCRGTTLTEALGIRTGRGDRRAVAITFDDGYADNLHNAAPVLARFGFKATCFIVANYVGGFNWWDASEAKKALMTKEEIRAWLDAGHEIGSHSLSHAHLPTLSAPEIAREVRDSRLALQDLLGTPVDHFSYPYGECSRFLVEQVEAAGYCSAVTTRPGIARPAAFRFALPRIPIDNRDGLVKYAIKVGTPFLDIRRHQVVQGVGSDRPS